MPNFTEPQSDDMTGFDSEKEKVVEIRAGFADGSIGFIERRVPLTETELLVRKIEKAKITISGLEEKLVDGSISEFEMTKLNALYKLISK